ncbi:hypothetical protein M0R45_025961 [Rubus argutus]|uniref:Uncharacterized protein n=1 Tax=Rubus argutus TaxID=59490 RepID=A0AAW1WYI6_RUBAR
MLTTSDDLNSAKPKQRGHEAREPAVELEFGNWSDVFYRHDGDARDTKTRRRRRQRSGKEWVLGEACNYSEHRSTTGLLGFDCGPLLLL